MGFQINDGKGRGTYAEVNSKNQLSTTSETRTSLSVAAKDSGGAYTVGTEGQISFSFSTGTDSGILYVKNNEDLDLFVDVCVLSQDQPGVFKYWKNPTGGTLISSGAATTAVNTNFGSSNALDCDAIIANAGDLTVTGGELVTFAREPAGGGVLDFLGTVVVPKGSSFALTYDPDSTGTVNITNFFIVHLDFEA